MKGKKIRTNCEKNPYEREVSKEKIRFITLTCAVLFVSLAALIGGCVMIASSVQLVQIFGWILAVVGGLGFGASAFIALSW